MVAYYLERLYPSFFGAETSMEKVETNDPDKIVDRMRGDKKCYGFRFFEREELEVNGEILSGENKNYSGIFYFGIELTKKELLEKIRGTASEDNVRHNMKQSESDRFVETRRGTIHPLRGIDKVLSDDGGK